MATAKKKSTAAKSRFNISKPLVWRIVLIASLTLNAIVVIAVIYGAQQLSNPATSRHSSEMLRYLISAQSTYCEKEGYDKLMNQIDAARNYNGQPDPNVSEEDILRHKRATSVLLCRVDYPSGKQVDDPALREIQQVSYPSQQ